VNRSISPSLTATSIFSAVSVAVFTTALAPCLQESIADAKVSDSSACMKALAKKSKLTDAANRHSTADKRLIVDG